MRPKVYCDKCRAEFGVKPKRFKKRELKHGYKVVFLKCPKCGEEFVIHFTSIGIENLQKRWAKEGKQEGTELHREIKRELRKVNNYMKLVYPYLDK